MKQDNSVQDDTCAMSAVTRKLGQCALFCTLYNGCTRTHWQATKQNLSELEFGRGTSITYNNIAGSRIRGRAADGIITSKPGILTPKGNE